MIKRGNYRPRTPSEFEQKIIDIRRVARVVAGGRRFSFRVVVVIGNKKGEVGVGMGKAVDTALAIDKAVRVAKKNRIKISLTKNNSIPHEIEAKFTQARITIRPARQGRGLVAGSSLRTVLYLGGVNDVVAKVLSRSKNKLNIAMATMKALKELKEADYATSSNKTKK
ncbi:30S ribosomal protein S5 [Patescibacteria group bacterium]|nr:30S ribosomal protein S5 [Patescibacteria group bacterium]MBU2633413.1 30S ribosomal protein S5 [Patescibacteria group bacterium]